jgi:hypothetical protein
MFFQNTKPTGAARLTGGVIYSLLTFNNWSYPGLATNLENRGIIAAEFLDSKLLFRYIVMGL